MQKKRRFRLCGIRGIRTNGGALQTRLIRFLLQTKRKEMQNMNIPSEYITKTEDVADQVKIKYISISISIFFSSIARCPIAECETEFSIFGYEPKLSHIKSSRKMWKRQQIRLILAHSCPPQVFVSSERVDYELSTSSFWICFAIVVWIKMNFFGDLTLMQIFVWVSMTWWYTGFRKRCKNKKNT